MAKQIVDLWGNWWKVWQKIGPPWRPAAKDIRFWEKQIREIQKHKNPKVLILGSTPEIRVMLAKNNISPTLLEANRPMYEAMSNLYKINTAKEKLVVGNWLDADKYFPKNGFDVVMGDLPHCNIEYAKWPSFFTAAHNILKPGGYFLLSTVNYDYSERQTIKEMLDKYRKNKKYFSDFKNRLWELYQLIDEPGVFDKKERRFNHYKLRKILVREALKSFSHEEIDENIWFISDDLNGELLSDVTEVSPKLEEQLILQSKWFSLENLLKIEDHPAFNIRRSMILRSKKLK